MSATLAINKLQIELTGVRSNVPNNDLAMLMYYLGCVFTVIQVEKNNKYCDYSKYYTLNKDDKKTVYELAKLFNPSIFINAGIFIINPGLLREVNANEFFRITDERVGVHVKEEIMIGLMSVKVLKIMACKSSWLENQYYIPFRRFSSLINFMGNR